MSGLNSLVIGGGPAGLMAAEILARGGVSVQVAEAKPSLARKLLMAGKSGLNLTNAAPPEIFDRAYGSRADALSPMVKAFGSQEIVAWAEALGQEMFTGPTGRVFPRAMKASPLLRAWISRLQALGVRFHTRWRWTGWDDGSSCFDTPDGHTRVTPDVTVLALGGASWARLGSDGQWADIFVANDLPVVPFKPANMGFLVHWSEKMRPRFGTPVKGVAWKADGKISRGEAVISERGLEGGGIYQISAAVRDGAAMRVDLLPDVTEDELAKRLGRPKGNASLSNWLRKSARLDPARQALLMEFGRPLPVDTKKLARLVKNLPVRHAGPRPLDEAISVAGGVPFDALTPELELVDRPGVFVCGEMLDWEAPTGGYLLTACMATGRWAGGAALRSLLPSAPNPAMPD